MAVTGVREVSAALRRKTEGMRELVTEALDSAAVIVLQDMKQLTPRDGANPGPHAADGLTMMREEDGLKVSIGLPTQELMSDYFWFRFLDGGTKGGEVVYRKGGKRFTMRVPARPALRILERAKDQNLGEIERLVREAVAEGLIAR